MLFLMSEVPLWQGVGSRESMVENIRIVGGDILAREAWWPQCNEFWPLVSVRADPPLVAACPLSVMCTNVLPSIITMKTNRCE